MPLLLSVVTQYTEYEYSFVGIWNPVDLCIVKVKYFTSFHREGSTLGFTGKSQ